MVMIPVIIVVITFDALSPKLNKPPTVAVNTPTSKNPNEKPMKANVGMSGIANSRLPSLLFLILKNFTFSNLFV